MGWGDFNAMVEGYERKKKDHYELLRQQTYMQASGWIKETYQQFSRRWKFDWERTANLLTKEEMPSAEQREKILNAHAAVLKMAKAKAKKK